MSTEAAVPGCANISGDTVVPAEGRRLSGLGDER
jgi:hypothetical protein